MRTVFIAAWAVLALAVSGCDPQRRGAPPLAVQRDSAGVRIVQSSVPDGSPAPWQVGEATLGLGAVEAPPEAVFSRVVGALRLADGGLVVGDGSTGEVRLFGAAGDFQRREGGKGEGPGEYEYLRAIEPCASDGFVAFDLNWSRNSYAADGTFVDDRQMLLPTGQPAYNLACDDDGRVAILGWGHVLPPPTGFFATRDRLLVVDAAGRVLADLGEWLVSERVGSASGSGPHPAGRATVFALHANQLFVGTGERFELLVFGLDGALRSIVRGPDVSLEVTDSLKNAYLDLTLARTSPPGRPAARNRIASMPWPAGRPAFTSLRVDPAGVVWLKRFSIDPGAPERWALFRPATGYLGDIELKPEERLLRPDSAELLLLARDEMDVEHVVVRPLDRGMPGS